MNHAVDRLRAYCKSTSTRPFKARGSSVIRCEKCLLASTACICPWQLQLNIPMEFILIMHRKEVYKTTNSGRLIADMFPHQTHAFLWDRTEPAAELLDLINDPNYHTVVLFPEQEETEKIENTDSTVTGQKPLRVILLDGTWKQASRMMRLSEWLAPLPRIGIHPEEQTQPYIRQAIRQGQLSTAQAAACLLQEQGMEQASEALHHYFSVFNQHCVSTRRNIPPEITESHRYLEACQERLRSSVT